MPTIGPMPERVPAGRRCAARPRQSTLKRWANVLGLKDAAKLLDVTLQQEAKTDEDLTTLADKTVNAKALNG